MIGFFVNFQPSEPYLSVYLTTEKSISKEELNNKVYPWDTYGSLVALLLVGSLVEFIGYRLTIVLGLFCREATRLILIFGDGVAWMSAMQATYAVGIGVNTVYFAYVYELVPEQDYRRATALLLTVYHVGSLFGSLLGELLYAHFNVPLSTLFYISLTCTTVGACFVAKLPRSQQPQLSSLDASSSHTPAPLLCGENALLLSLGRWKQAARALVRQPLVAMWCLWWLLIYAWHIMLSNYYQTLFLEKQVSADAQHRNHFGLIEAFIEVTAVLGYALAGAATHETSHTQFVSALSLTLLCGVAWLVAPMFDKYTAYIAVIVSAGLYAALKTLSMAALAHALLGHYGAAFSCATFLALSLGVILQSILSLYHVRLVIF